MSSGPRFHASAPVRLDFAGGWTDVPPFSTDQGGAVVNATINLRVSATVTPGGSTWRLHATDLGEYLETDVLRWDGSLQLHQAALRRGGMRACELSTSSSAPAGSGLGSSGALGVSLVAAIDAARGISRSLVETAEEAWRVEAVEADLAGGRQDQYAAALGGFNHFRFGADGVQVEKVEVDADFAAWLAQSIVLCYTGASRISSRMIAHVMDGYAAGNRPITTALRGLAALAGPMAKALSERSGAEVGDLLRKNWRYQLALDPGMVTPEMHRLDKAMLRMGCRGGKAAGAGAGGCMFFLCSDPEAGRKVATNAGARVIPFAWDPEGVRTWRE